MDSPARAYTPDGFLELFRDVIAPNLMSAGSTTSSTAVEADEVATIAVLSATDIEAYAEVVVDVGSDAEVVVVKNVSGLNVSARFAKAHSGTYPVAVMSGESRLRMLLWDANAAWKAAQSSEITGNAGLKQLGRGEIEWFSPGAVLNDTLEHYRSIVLSISELVKVRPAWSSSRGSGRLEAY
jgi:hypothetical protein